MTTAIRRLSARRSELAQYDAERLAQPVSVYMETWRRRLDNWRPGGKFLEEHQDAGAERATATFDRAEFPDLARAVLRSDAPTPVLRLFIACQIWGSGRTNGRGPRYLEAALRDPAHAATVLRETAEMVEDGRAGRAYQIQHRRLSGWGRPFASKFLYAVALGVDEQHPAALILDSRVWAALGALGWSSLEAAGTNRWDVRYEAYVAAMHSWAVELGCRADSIEQLLFKHGARI